MNFVVLFSAIYFLLFQNRGGSAATSPPCQVQCCGTAACSLLTYLPRQPQLQPGQSCIQVDEECHLVISPTTYGRGGTETLTVTSPRAMQMGRGLLAFRYIQCEISQNNAYASPIKTDSSGWVVRAYPPTASCSMPKLAPGTANETAQYLLIINDGSGINNLTFKSSINILPSSTTFEPSTTPTTSTRTTWATRATRPTRVQTVAAEIKPIENDAPVYGCQVPADPEFCYIAFPFQLQANDFVPHMTKIIYWHELNDLDMFRCEPNNVTNDCYREESNDFYDVVIPSVSRQCYNGSWLGSVPKCEPPAANQTETEQLYTRFLQDYLNENANEETLMVSLDDIITSLLVRRKFLYTNYHQYLVPDDDIVDALGLSRQRRGVFDLECPEVPCEDIIEKTVIDTIGAVKGAGGFAKYIKQARKATSAIQQQEQQKQQEQQRDKRQAKATGQNNWLKIGRKTAKALTSPPKCLLETAQAALSIASDLLSFCIANPYCAAAKVGAMAGGVVLDLVRLGKDVKRMWECGIFKQMNQTFISRPPPVNFSLPVVNFRICFQCKGWCDEGCYCVDCTWYPPSSSGEIHWTPAPPPPRYRSASIWGDPHIRTFDGLSFPFMAVGEYWLLRPTTDRGLAIQARMEATVKQWPGATWLTSLALRYDDDEGNTQIIGVFVRPEGRSEGQLGQGGGSFVVKQGLLGIQQNQSEVPLRAHQHGLTEVPGCSVSISSNRKEASIRLFAYSLTINFQVGYFNSMDIQLSAVGESLFKDGEFDGLFGNANDETYDDMSYGNGTIFSESQRRRLLPSSKTRILSKAWAMTSQNESFLYYANDTVYEDLAYHGDTSVRDHCDMSRFPEEALAICGSSLACLCDFLATNNTAQVARSTRSAEQWVARIEASDKAELKPAPAIICSFIKAPANGSFHLQVGMDVASFSHDGNMTVVFSCDEGFQLEGRRSADCFEGNWTAEPPVCIKTAFCSRASLPNDMIVLAPNGFNLWSNVTLLCYPAYTIKSNNGTEDSAFLQCVGQDKWNASVPSCAERQVSEAVTTDSAKDQVTQSSSSSSKTTKTLSAVINVKSPSTLKPLGQLTPTTTITPQKPSTASASNFIPCGKLLLNWLPMLIQYILQNAL